MKSIIRPLICIVIIISFVNANPMLNVEKELIKQSSWLTGAQMSNVWVYTGIPSGITRSTCCSYSDPENACHKGSQASSSCDSWRINDDFLFVFPK